MGRRHFGYKSVRWRVIRIFLLVLLTVVVCVCEGVCVRVV